MAALHNLEPRYEVCSIDGYEGDSTKRTWTYWIADRLNCFREVAWFPARKSVHRVTRRQHAERRCAELNAEHEAWMTENVYAGDAAA